MGDVDDVMKWDLSQVPFEVREDMGPAYVWYGRVLLRQFPWHVYGHVEPSPGPRAGDLYIVDVSGNRVRPLAHYERGKWTDFNRRPVPPPLEPR